MAINKIHLSCHILYILLISNYANLTAGACVRFGKKITVVASYMHMHATSCLSC